MVNRWGEEWHRKRCPPETNMALKAGKRSRLGSIGGFSRGSQGEGRGEGREGRGRAEARAGLFVVRAACGEVVGKVIARAANAPANLAISAGRDAGYAGKFVTLRRKYFYRGASFVLRFEAEITPLSPDPDNAGVEKLKKLCKLSLCCVWWPLPPQV